MTLTKQTVAAIVKVVVADPESKQRTESVFSAMPDGWAGGTRNALMVAGWMVSFGNAFDPTEPDVAQYVCTGITEATAAAINRALETKDAKQQLDPHLALVKQAGPVSRELFAHHTATLIEMVDGSSYVLDWHASLDLSNPMVSTLADWKLGKGDVPFAEMPAKILGGSPKVGAN